jgi:hypothetical protein
MTRKSLLIAAAVTAALATGSGVPAAIHDDDDDRHDRKRRLKADLSGFNEDPMTRSTTGRGSFRGTLSRAEDEIEWRLEYRGLEGDVSQAHIHFGGHHQSGGISVFLCTNLGNGSAGTPACPASPAEVTGRATAADVIGPTDQGIAAGEFAELVRAIKGGVTYVNVHTSLYAGGEIRGQIKLDD